MRDDCIGKDYSNVIVMAFDLGTKKIGVAVGQVVTCTASPLTVFRVGGKRSIYDLTGQLIYNWNPGLVVIGLPSSPDRGRSRVVALVTRFSRRLAANFHVKVVLHGEDYSTVEAIRYVRCRRHRKNSALRNVDAYSAAIILESWMRERTTCSTNATLTASRDQTEASDIRVSSGGGR